MFIVGGYMKYIMIGLLGSILNFLPFNMREHIYILDNMFNTDIFKNELFYIMPLCMIPILFPTKKINKKNAKDVINSFRLLIPVTPIIIIKFFWKIEIKSFKVICFIFLLFSITLLCFRKNKNNNTNYIKIFLINLLSLIPGISILYTFLLSIKNYKVTNRIKLALVPYLLDSLLFVKIINFNYYLLISIGICVVLSYIIYWVIKNSNGWKRYVFYIILSIMYWWFFR